MQVMKEHIVTVNTAHSLLKQRQTEGNLSYEQQNTLNYLEDLIKLGDKDSDKMVKALKDAGLTEWQAVKVVDLLPKKEDELKIVLAGSGPVGDGQLKKAFEIVKEYRKGAKEPAKSKKVEPPPVPVEEKKDNAAGASEAAQASEAETVKQAE